MTNIEVELAELKVNVKNVLTAVTKIEKVVETQAVVMEKQSTTDKKILSLECLCEKLRQQIQDLKINNTKTTAYASWVATIVSFVLSKFL